jgi:hypothetical protein
MTITRGTFLADVLLLVTFIAQTSPTKQTPAKTQSAGALKIELTNNLGVTATVNVTEFTSGNKVNGDTLDPYTPELNELGGEWVSEPTKAVTLAFPNGVREALSELAKRNRDFAKSRLVIDLDDRTPGQFVLIPWRSVKALSIKNKMQVVTLNDGTEYRGQLRTILSGNSDSENKVYELSGVRSMTILQFPAARPYAAGSANNSTGAKVLRWGVTGTKMPSLIVTHPRFAHSERFRVGELNQPGISAAFSDFQSVSIGSEKRGYGFPITVKAKNASAASGILALGDDDYLEGNGTVEVVGDLANGCSIVFRVIGPLTMTRAD